MDFLDFEGTELYFDEPVSEEVEELLAHASDEGRNDEAETFLMRAYFLQPEHFTVLVAVYRFYYYTQRYKDALIIADRVIGICSEKLKLNTDWSLVSNDDISKSARISMVLTRFYLFALKSSGYILLRMERIDEALARLKKLSALDPSDQFGSSPLIEIAGEYLVSARRNSFRAI